MKRGAADNLDRAERFPLQHVRAGHGGARPAADAAFPPVDFALAGPRHGGRAAAWSSAEHDLDAALIARRWRPTGRACWTCASIPPHRARHGPQPRPARARSRRRQPSYRAKTAPQRSPTMNDRISHGIQHFRDLRLHRSAAPDGARLPADLQNLDEWTLGSRMVEQVDDSTWIGTASGYQHDSTTMSARSRTRLPRHRVAMRLRISQILQMPTRSCCSPPITSPAARTRHLSALGERDRSRAQRTPMIMQGIQTVHNSEVRALKAALEREGGADRGRPRGAHG